MLAATCARPLLFALLVGAASASGAATIAIQGSLGFVSDQGGGVYAGVGVGAAFSGFIDDASFAGEISDGATLTSFGCCIAAGGLAVQNDIAIDSATAALLNALSGTSAFSAGQVFDGVDIEGDVATAGGGRLEVGVSYLLDASAFSDGAASNYPFDPSDLRVALFFIHEEDGVGQDVYDGIGLLTTVPEPSVAALLAIGALGALPIRRRH